LFEIEKAEGRIQSSVSWSCVGQIWLGEGADPGN